MGVAEIQKMSPSTTDQSPSRNCISRPGVVVGMRTYLASVFPLFHASGPRTLSSDFPRRSQPHTLLTLLQYAAIGSSCVPPSLQPSHHSHHTSLPIIISHSDAISPQFGDDRVAAWAVLQPGRDKLISQRLLETAISIIS